MKPPSLPRTYEETCTTCAGTGRTIYRREVESCPACTGEGTHTFRLHSIAVDWYRSLARSGQARFYEPSDWQMARFVAVEMSRTLRKGVSAVAIQALVQAMGELLTSEGSRRRLRLELEKPKGDDENVTVLDDYRGMTG